MISLDGDLMSLLQDLNVEIEGQRIMHLDGELGWVNHHMFDFALQDKNHHFMIFYVYSQHVNVTWVLSNIYWSAISYHKMLYPPCSDNPVD